MSSGPDLQFHINATWSGGYQTRIPQGLPAVCVDGRTTPLSGHDLVVRLDVLADALLRRPCTVNFSNIMHIDTEDQPADRNEQHGGQLVNDDLRDTGRARHHLQDQRQCHTVRTDADAVSAGRTAEGQLAHV